MTGLVLNAGGRIFRPTNDSEGYGGLARGVKLPYSNLAPRRRHLKNLEMSGIPSLAFAVGVYLPLSSSSPIFIGGMVRWLVDKYLHRKFRDKNLSEVELTAEGDKSPGVLLASGYIAGGALAGIVIAFMAGVPSLVDISKRIEDWSTANNPFFNGAHSDLLAMFPFILLSVLLYLVGRDLLLVTRPRRSKA